MHQSKVHFGGELGKRLKADMENWQLIAPYANPGMSEMFLNSDRLPRKQLVPWYGEFPGKYITAAAAAYACNPDPRLEEIVESLIRRLIAAQDESGLLSPHPRSEELKGHSLHAWGENGEFAPLWELWAYYHLISGLLDWMRQTGSPAAYRLARSVANGVSKAFLSGNVHLEEASANENLGLAHGFARLYQAFGQKEDQDMMSLILQYAESQRHYVEGSENGKEFYELPWPRWEALHVLQALGESGDERAISAMLRLTDGIRHTDRHNTGGFSSGERACGDPYDMGAIETCCVVAWMALLESCYRQDGDPKWIDELELALWNAAMGAQHPTGRWWTYNTPTDGVRRASAHDIVFQAMEGSPELNCCSVNAPRMLGMTSDWGLCVLGDEITLNFYGESRWMIQLGDGTAVHIHESTAYPVDSRVQLVILPERRAGFVLRLRIPAWSEQSTVLLNGQPMEAICGEYLSIGREWMPGDTVELCFDFSLHAWRGKRACESKSALYRGPLLLAFDQRFNMNEPDDMPEIHPEALEMVAFNGEQDWFPPQLLLRDVANGAVLCDFASAGATGTRYASWLRLAVQPRKSPFSVD